MTAQPQHQPEFQPQQPLHSAATPQGFPDDRWQQFIGARTSIAFCKSWLALLQSRLPTLKLASVLIAGDNGALVPVATWPDKVADFKHWDEAIAQTFASTPPKARALDLGGAVVLTRPIQIHDKTAALVCLELEAAGQDTTAAEREFHWACAWLMHLLSQHEHQAHAQGAGQLQAVMDLTAVSLREGGLQHTLYELLYELRAQFGCQCVSLGWVNGLRVKLAARSDTATSEKNSPLTAATRAAMEECLDQGRMVECNADAPLPAHQALRTLLGAGYVFSTPLMAGHESIGVLTFERSDATSFTPEQCARIDTLARLLGGVLHQRRQAEAHAGRRLVQHLKSFGQKIFGPRHLVLKLAVSTTVVVLAALIFLPIEHRVRAHTVIEGAVQHTLAAPFQGFMGASYHRAGDTVRAGQVIAALDTRDLLLERTKAMSEREQFDRKTRDALAQHDVGTLQVLRAQHAQAEAALALIEEKIQRANLTAPMDGILISGDWSQQIGAPIETGQKLFEVAPLANFRVILEVDERDIAYVKDAQRGQLVLTGADGAPLDFTVAKITPLATAKDGKNVFRVEARLQNANKPLLPGMEGVGKIHAGERSLGWVLFHPFADWLSLKLWHLVP